MIELPRSCRSPVPATGHLLTFDVGVRRAREDCEQSSGSATHAPGQHRNAVIRLFQSNATWRTLGECADILSLTFGDLHAVHGHIERGRSVTSVHRSWAQPWKRGSGRPLGTDDGTSLQSCCGWTRSSSSPSLTKRTRSSNSRGLNAIGSASSGSSRASIGSTGLKVDPRTPGGVRGLRDRHS